MQLVNISVRIRVNGKSFLRLNLEVTSSDHSTNIQKSDLVWAAQKKENRSERRLTFCAAFAVHGHIGTCTFMTAKRFCTVFTRRAVDTCVGALFQICSKTQAETNY